MSNSWMRREPNSAADGAVLPAMRYNSPPPTKEPYRSGAIKYERNRGSLGRPRIIEGADSRNDFSKTHRAPGP